MVKPTSSGLGNGGNSSSGSDDGDKTRERLLAAQRDYLTYALGSIDDLGDGLLEAQYDMVVFEDDLDEKLSDRDWYDDSDIESTRRELDRARSQFDWYMDEWTTAIDRYNEQVDEYNEILGDVGQRMEYYKPSDDSVLSDYWDTHVKESRRRKRR